MARINIEECWWSDPRRLQLIGSVGLMADALAVNAWRMAQEFWGKGELIPFKIFSALSNCEALIKAGLSRIHESICTISNEIRTPFERTPNAAEPSDSGSVSDSDSGFKKNVGIRINYPEEFNQIFEDYGRRGDKKEAYNEYLKLKLNPEKLSHLGKAISNYVKSTPEVSYRKHLCRFLKSDWREFINYIQLVEPSKSPTGRWLTPEEKKRQNTAAAVEELISEVQMQGEDYQHG